MADNVSLNTMSGGDAVGADDISSVKYQRIKLIFGADGTNEGDVSSTNPLPVLSKIISDGGGWDIKMCSSADGSTALTNTAQAVKASAGKLGGYSIYNPNTSAVFVQIYNTAQGSVTVGTTNPRLMVTIPAGALAHISYGESGIKFDTAIAVSATSTAGGNGAPTTALDTFFLFI